jgi:DnaK suppressor protein
MLCPVNHLPSGSYSKGEFHPMNAKNLQRFEKQLKNWLAELVPEADAKIKDMQRLETHQADRVDHATTENGRRLLLRFRSREGLLIRKIENSLQSIQKGTYGICEACGEDIGLKRLEARPVARYCIGCKTRMEKAERLAGR